MTRLDPMSRRGPKRGLSPTAELLDALASIANTTPSPPPRGHCVCGHFRAWHDRGRGSCRRCRCASFAQATLETLTWCESCGRYCEAFHDCRKVDR